MATPTVPDLLLSLANTPEAGMSDRGLLTDMARCAAYLDAVWGNNTAENKPELVVWMTIALRTGR